MLNASRSPARASIDMRIRVAFWVRPYLSACAVAAAVTGTTPNVARICQFVVDKGVRVDLPRPPGAVRPSLLRILL